MGLRFHRSLRLAVLPSLERVERSGFTQRIDASTGRVRDEYVTSVRVPRAGWARLDFTHPSAIDVVACLDAFEIRRDLSPSGRLGSIEPFRRFHEGPETHVMSPEPGVSPEGA